MHYIRTLEQPRYNVKALDFHPAYLSSISARVIGGITNGSAPMHYLFS